VTKDRPASRIDLLVTAIQAARGALHTSVLEALAQRELAWRTADDLPQRPRLTDPQRARYVSVLASAARTRRRR
jgi:hypothetical protein